MIDTQQVSLPQRAGKTAAPLTWTGTCFREYQHLVVPTAVHTMRRVHFNAELGVHSLRADGRAA